MKAYFLPHPPLIIEDIGKKNEIPSTKNSYEKVRKEIADYNPDAVIVISPHGISFHDGFFVNTLSQYNDDLANYDSKVKIDIPIDTQLSKSIIEIMENDFNFQCGGSSNNINDHATIIACELLGIKKIVNTCQCQGMSALEHYKFGMAIKKACQQLKRKVVFVASGDMSHALKSENGYTYHKDGPSFDQAIQKYLNNEQYEKILTMDYDFLHNAAQCGWKSLVTLFGFFDCENIKTKILSYEGPYGVGYLSAAFEGNGKCDSLLPSIEKYYSECIRKNKLGEDKIVELARRCVEHLITHHENIPIPKIFDEELMEKAGVFVTIHKGNNLRGCVGTILPVTDCIGHEIIRNAYESALDDERFPPVIAQELPFLWYSVDVLSHPMKIISLKELNPKKYGIIVKTRNKTGVLLPDLDGVNTVDEQIRIAKQKARIESDETIEIFKFDATRHQPARSTINSLFTKVKKVFSK